MTVDLELVARITAKRYCAPTASYDADDAAQVALLALHRKFGRYDPTRGMSERSYAIKLVIQAVKRANVLAAHKPAGTTRLPCDVGIDEGRHRRYQASAPRGMAGDSARAAWASCLTWEDDGPDQADAREAVGVILTRCTPRQRLTAKLFMESGSLAAVAGKLKCSRERVHQILEGIALRLRRETGYEREPVSALTRTRGRVYALQRTKANAAARYQYEAKLPVPVKSNYRGVRYERRRQTSATPWGVEVYFQGKRYRCGSYATEREAAEAYDRHARRIKGDAARLNFGLDSNRERPADAAPVATR